MDGSGLRLVQQYRNLRVDDLKSSVSPLISLQQEGPTLLYCTAVLLHSSEVNFNVQDMGKREEVHAAGAPSGQSQPGLIGTPCRRPAFKDHLGGVGNTMTGTGA